MRLGTVMLFGLFILTLRVLQTESLVWRSFRNSFSSRNRGSQSSIGSNHAVGPPPAAAVGQMSGQQLSSTMQQQRRNSIVRNPGGYHSGSSSSAIGKYEQPRGSDLYLFPQNNPLRTPQTKFLTQGESNLMTQSNNLIGKYQKKYDKVQQRYNSKLQTQNNEYSDITSNMRNKIAKSEAKLGRLTAKDKENWSTWKEQRQLTDRIDKLGSKLPNMRNYMQRYTDVHNKRTNVLNQELVRSHEKYAWQQGNKLKKFRDQYDKEQRVLGPNAQPAVYPSNLDGALPRWATQFQKYPNKVKNGGYTQQELAWPSGGQKPAYDRTSKNFVTQQEAQAQQQLPMYMASRKHVRFKRNAALRHSAYKKKV